MNIGQRLENLDRYYLYEKGIMARKASDYSGDEDCNRNLMACEALGICQAEQGIMIRLFDKIQRLSNLLFKEAKVKDESIQDTVHDARNYLAILLDIINEKKQAKLSSARPEAVPAPSSTSTRSVPSGEGDTVEYLLANRS